jgi:hypothetical protein
VTRPVFRRPQQAQLQSMAAVTSNHPDAAEIARVVGARRWDHSGEGDCQFVMMRKPPMSLSEFGNGRTFKERQSMKVGERVSNLVVVRIDFAYPVHRPNLLIPAYCRPPRPDQ